MKTVSSVSRNQQQEDKDMNGLCLSGTSTWTHRLVWSEPRGLNEWTEPGKPSINYGGLVLFEFNLRPDCLFF